MEGRRYGGGSGGGNSRHYHHHNTPYDRSSNPSSSSYNRESGNKRFAGGYSRPRTIEEILLTDTLLTFDQFIRIDDYASRQSDIERQRLYEEYLIKHRRMAAERLFLQHKNEAWFQEHVIANSQVTAESHQRYSSFKSKINEDFLETLSLEDGSDIQLMDSSSDSSIRNLSSSMRLPERFCDPTPININNLTVLISNIPPGLPKSTLSQALNMISGGLVKLELDDPVPEKGFYRIGWATFEEGTDMMACISKLEQNLINGEKLYYSYQKSFTRQLSISPTPTDESIQRRHVRICEELVEVLNKRANIPDSETNEILEMIKNRPFIKQLDFLTCFLRQVHFCCFHCSTLAPNESSLRKSCGHLHIRGKVPLPFSSFNPEGFLEITKTHFDPATVDFLIERTVERVDEGRFRCPHCSKLFRGPEFVVKHIKLKHEDILKGFEEDITLLNNYFEHPFMLLAPPPLNLSSSQHSHSHPSHHPSSFQEENGTTTASSGYYGGGGGGMGGRRNSRDRYNISGGRSGSGTGLPPPPPPESATTINRQLQRYVDLDAPPTGDIEISYE